MPRNFTSPVGRMVQGDVFDPQTKDQQGNLRVVKSGPNVGQPSPQWFMALAFAKTDPAWPPFLADLIGESAASWPALFPAGGQVHAPPAFGCTNPKFSFKIMDGDGFDDNGKANNTKEGFAGHWVVKFTSGFAPKVYLPAGPNAYVETSDRNAAKRGYYYRIAGSLKSNENAQKPGIYVNISLIEVVGTGPEIVSGPDAATAFGAPAALPPGATALAPAAPGLGAPAAPPAPPAAPVAPAAPAAPLAPPYAGYVPGAPAAPAAPAGPVMTALLPAGQTYASMIGAGWTDETLVAHGMMVAAAPAAPAAPLAPPPAPPAPPPAPPAPPAPPPAPRGPVMLAPANGATYEQLKALGWTDAAMHAHGMAMFDQIPV